MSHSANTPPSPANRSLGGALVVGAAPLAVVATLSAPLLALVFLLGVVSAMALI